MRIFDAIALENSCKREKKPLVIGAFSVMMRLLWILCLDKVALIDKQWLYKRLFFHLLLDSSLEAKKYITIIIRSGDGVSCCLYSPIV